MRILLFLLLAYNEFIHPAQPFNLRYIVSRAILGIVRKRQVQQQKSRIDATT